MAKMRAPLFFQIESNIIKAVWVVYKIHDNAHGIDETSFPWWLLRHLLQSEAVSAEMKKNSVSNTAKKNSQKQHEMLIKEVQK